ncbi:MAG: TadE/TadG family type IV pilus assembly protein [Acidobacteriaceae bacterium]
MTARRIARRLRCRRGQSLVESALSLGIIIAVLIGILELTLALYCYNYVAYAAREATRWAMVRGSTCTGLSSCNATADQIQTYVQNLNYPIVQPSQLAVTTTWLSRATLTPASWTTCSAAPCNLPGNEVQVEVAYPFTMEIPIVGQIGLNLHSTSSMVISQ